MQRTSTSFFFVEKRQCELDRLDWSIPSFESLVVRPFEYYLFDASLQYVREMLGAVVRDRALLPGANENENKRSIPLPTLLLRALVVASGSGDALALQSRAVGNHWRHAVFLSCLSWKGCPSHVLAKR